MNGNGENPIIIQQPTTVEAPHVETVSATTVLVLGIVAAATSFLGIPGIIVGAIGGKKASAYMREHGGSIFGQAKAGRILSKVGLICGIVMTVWYVLAFVIGFLAGLGVLASVFADSEILPEIAEEFYYFDAVIGCMKFLHF